MDRGGLTVLCQEMQQIFIIAEQKYCSKIFLKDCSVNSSILAADVTREIDVFSVYSSIIDALGVNLESEITTNTA